MKFELKRPRIIMQQKTYGAYLIDHPDMIPEQGIPLDTPGYVITGTDYGTTTFTSLPFKNGDWVDEEFVKNNLIEV